MKLHEVAKGVYAVYARDSNSSNGWVFLGTFCLDDWDQDNVQGVKP